jgi:hypothetical protein
LKNKEGRERYVLIGESGKQASRTDQSEMALLLEALHLKQQGSGGGVINVLLTASTVSSMKISRLDGNYTTKLVKSRGKGEEQSVTQECRQAVADSDFIAKLAVLFEHKASTSQRVRSAIIREFSKWISIELKDPNSQAYKLIESIYPCLTQAQRKSSWWEKQIASRKPRVKH